MTITADQMAFLRAARRLARAMDVHSSRINRQSGLTLPQLIVLACVADLRDGTSREIASAAELSPPTVVGILDKLTEKGLIARARSNGDRRLVQSRLTEAGRAALRAASDPLGPQFGRRLAALPPADRGALLAALRLAVDLCADEDESNAAEPDPLPGARLG